MNNRVKSNPKPVTASFVSLGCFKNSVDTEVMGGFLEKRGVRVVSSYETADWLLINTCGFIRDAKEESIDEIFSALDRKQKREIRHIAVFGCLTQRYMNELRRNFPEVDILWGVNDLESLADYIASGNKAVYGDGALFLYSHTNRRIHTTPPNTAFIKISEGCDMSCTFCIIPKIRGKFRSRNISSIVEEATAYRNRGISEINLVSQNSTHFGIDRNNHESLPRLLKALSDIGFPWIRLLYMMPEEVNEEIIDTFSLPGMVPYFDLPFQHVVPRLLKRMGRGGDKSRSMKLIERIRKKFPDSAIRSSLIAGFPGESEAEFYEMLQFAHESHIDYIGTFAYSDEEDTEAFHLEDKIPPELIQERYERLQEVSINNLQNYWRRLQGTRQEFLPQGPWTHRSTVGRIRSQAPEIDGLTQVQGKFNENFSIVPIEITGYQDQILSARRITKKTFEKI